GVRIEAGVETHAARLPRPHAGRAVPGKVEVEIPQVGLRLVAAADTHVVVPPRRRPVDRGGRGRPGAEVAGVREGGDLLAETVDFVAAQGIEPAVLRQLGATGA